MKRSNTYSITSSYPPEVQEMMDNAKQCLNCGKTLSRLQSKEGRRNRGYCTLACMSLKPPRMAYAEIEYGKPAKEIILNMLNNGSTVIATANLLGVNKPALYVWMQKLNIKKKVVYL